MGALISRLYQKWNRNPPIILKTLRNIQNIISSCLTKEDNFKQCKITFFLLQYFCNLPLPTTMDHEVQRNLNKACDSFLFSQYQKHSMPHLRRQAADSSGFWTSRCFLQVNIIVCLCLSPSDHPSQISFKKSDLNRACNCNYF